MNNDFKVKIKEENQKWMELAYLEYTNKLIDLEKNMQHDYTTVCKTEKENDFIELEKRLEEYLKNLGDIEEALSGNNIQELNNRLLHIQRIFRELQNKYLSCKFNFVNNKLESSIKEKEESMSSILFNVVSIFLGISITSAMVAGIAYIKSYLLIF